MAPAALLVHADLQRSSPAVDRTTLELTLVERRLSASAGGRKLKDVSRLSMEVQWRRSLQEQPQHCVLRPASCFLTEADFLNFFQPSASKTSFIHGGLNATDIPSELCSGMQPPLLTCVLSVSCLSGDTSY